MLRQVERQYDGYHFDYDTVGLYNPFSIFNTLSKLKFSDYGLRQVLRLSGLSAEHSTIVGWITEVAGFGEFTE